MSDSRIQVNEIDKSTFVPVNVETTGGMVIEASKGPEKPVMIAKGSETKLVRMFGYPSTDFPNVWEAIAYNKEFPLWLSAPVVSAEAFYGGIVVTPAGTIPLTKGFADPSTLNLATVDFVKTIGTGDGVTTIFSDTLQLPYVHQSIDVEVDGISIDVVASDAEPEILTAASLTSGTMTRATGALEITFTVAPAEGEVITAVSQANFSDAYFTIFQASPHAQIESLKITYNDVTSFFEIEYYIKNHRGVNTLIDTYIVSSEKDTFDGFGQNIYIEEIFADNFHLTAIGTDTVYSSFIDDISNVLFGGGIRGGVLTSTELTAGWDYFKQKNIYSTQIFMDCSADDSIPALFDSLRKNDQRYKDYLIPLPDNEVVATSKTTKEGYSINNRGLSFFWNWRLTKETYTKTRFYTSQIGEIGKKFAQMHNIFNGLAPAMIDENNHGGQLSGTILELRYDPEDIDIKTLADAGVNAIIFDPTYGVMITHHRTGQTPAVLSDKSFIAHSRLFDYIISTIIKNVLTFQITKLNDTVHRTMAQSKAQSVLNPILGANLLREAVAICNESNNTDEVLNRREFKLTVVVKVTPTSEKIILDFINIDQTTTVEETIA